MQRRRKQRITNRIKPLTTRTIDRRLFTDRQRLPQQIPHRIPILQLRQPTTHHIAAVPALSLLGGQLTAEILVGASIHPLLKGTLLPIVQTRTALRRHLIQTNPPRHSLPRIRRLIGLITSGKLRQIQLTLRLLCIVTLLTPLTNDWQHPRLVVLLPARNLRLQLIRCHTGCTARHT